MKLLDSDPLWTVDGLSFNWRDDYGVEWSVGAAEGWDSAPPLRLQLEDRPQNDGSFDSPSYRGARVVTLQGAAWCPSPAGREGAVDRFLGMFAEGGSLKPLTVQEATRTRMAMVRVSGEPRTERVGDRSFSWQVSFVAPDPRKYSAELSTITLELPSTSVSGGFTAPFTAAFTSGIPSAAVGEKVAHNAGTVPTEPMVTITGPVTNPSLWNVGTGQRLQLEYDLAAGNTLVIDFRNRVVLLNGSTPVAALALGSSFLSLKKGSNLLRYTAFAGASGAPMTITYRSAWN